MNFKQLLPIPLVALTALLCAPVSGSAQSILLTAGDFTLLGGTAITSTGVAGTIIRNGNIGLAPGATSGITGFPPAVVVNGAIVATGAATSQARLDLIRASVGLAGMASNANMSTVDLGGKTLAPGVYTFNSAASLTGALVLDAQGQNSVAWVFQIGTALTTSINSTITFINLGTNGGSDLGLFWNAGSAINVGGNNQIAGNYLSGTSISFGGLSGGGGRALALAGVSLDNNIINARGGFGGGDYTGGLKYDPSGAVVLSGGSGGTTSIAPGGVNGGTGTFGGNVLNSGTLSPGLATPGAAPDSVSVAGNYTQASTGTLVIQLASATSFDRLVVAGTASLAGTVQVDTLGGYDPLGRSFTFLTAAGGRSGTFSTLSGNATTNRAAIAATLSYAPNTVTVSFTQLPFAMFALTPNQIATANAAQKDPAITNALNVLSQANQFPPALNALSPQDYQVWSDFAFAHATALSDHLLQSGRMPTGCDDYYFEGGQRRGRARSDLDLGSSAYTASNGLIGGNKALNRNTTVGAFFGFGKTTAGLGSGGVSQTTVKDKTIGVRAAVTHGPMWAEAMLAYGMDTYSSTRAISFPGTAAVAKSFTRGHQWTTGITVGQDLKAGSLTVSPFAGLLASRWKANSFTETGAGEFSATLGNQRARSLRSQLGAEARYTLGIIQPHVRAAWLHEFSNGSRSMPASFGASNNFSLMTRRAPRNTMLYSAGVDVLFGPRALLYTDFTAQGGGDTKVLNEWRVGLSVSF